MLLGTGGQLERAVHAVAVKSGAAVGEAQQARIEAGQVLGHVAKISGKGFDVLLHPVDQRRRQLVRSGGAER
jgi:hypothetical protein